MRKSIKTNEVETCEDYENLPQKIEIDQIMIKSIEDSKKYKSDARTVANS